MVIAETVKTRPVSLAYEMLGLARGLADQQGGTVAACVLGCALEEAAENLIKHGADTVYLVDAECLADYQADSWLPDLLAVIAHSRPKAVIVGHSSVGADLAPRLAFRLDSAVVTACIDARVHDDKLHLTRPCYGGKANEVVSVSTSPVVFTIKAKSFEALPRRDNAMGSIVRMTSVLDPTTVRTKVREVRRNPSEGVTLESARAIVAGGGGMKGPAGFELAERLARLLDGAVGASRVACDLGWCPPSYQIGLSGKTVAPELYVAIGISGTGQHMAGCANAKTIVAINTDRDAPIFRFARYGVVGDCHRMMLALIEQLETRRK
jgi:electron transfer flavoprotein alpha subunit